MCLCAAKMSEKMTKEKSNEYIAMQKFDYFRRFLAQVNVPQIKFIFEERDRIENHSIGVKMALNPKL